MALSILSLNCNGIRDQSKRNGLLQWLRSLHTSVGIVCLQETHCVSVAECSLWFQYAKIDLETAKGVQVRSCIRWVEEGESSSAYFFRLERKKAADRWISALRESDGTIVSSPADLCCSFASFICLFLLLMLLIPLSRAFFLPTYHLPCPSARLLSVRVISLLMNV